MLTTDLPSGTLILLLQHQLTGCHRAARRAIDLLNRLADGAGPDEQVAGLCRRMGERLEAHLARSGT